MMVAVRFQSLALDTNCTMIFGVNFKLMSWVLFPVFMLGLYLILSLIIKDIDWQTENHIAHFLKT